MWEYKELPVPATTQGLHFECQLQWAVSLVAELLSTLFKSYFTY